MASASRASPEEASAQEWRYEVFLSFRGADTRQGITSAIYHELQNTRGIETFMDGQRIQVGDDISPTLLQAIKESRFAIVVLSQQYADSTWCLEELITIFKCMKDKSRIFPLFYHVDPSDVRYQKGAFGEAFAKHDSRHGIEKVKQWKDALRNVASLSGWDSNNYCDLSDEGLVSDKKLVDDIVKLVYSKVLQLRVEAPRDFEEFEATKLTLGKIMKVIQDYEVTVIALYGIKGVGKTTLVKHVGALARGNKLFNKVIMAVLSQISDLCKIQDQLADMLALKFEKDAEEKGRAFVLKEAILRENKLLIILDDVWRILPLSSIGIPNNEELRKRNSKVMFTTWIQKLCQEMHSDVKISLGILSEEDSLKLFSKKVRLDYHEPTEKYYRVAMEVTRNCAGVPVALASVAIELRDKDLDEWKKAAERVRGSQSGDENTVFNCIKLCSESTDARSYLLLFCLFPENYDIPIEDVFRYGIGKGMFQEFSTLHEARARADLLVKSLKDLGLLLESVKKGCVKMHHVIRDPQWVKFDITFSAKASDDDYDVDVADLPVHESQKSLCLRTSIVKLPDWFHKVVSEKTERLVYFLFRDVRNILDEYGNGRLNGVKYLYVMVDCGRRFSLMWRGLMNMVTWDVPRVKRPVFENLEELHVEDVPCMQLCVGKLPLGSLCNLKKFKVLACSNMEGELLSSNLLERLQNLEELICGDLSRIRYMFGTHGMEPEQIIFTKPRKIHLRNLPNLRNMCSGGSASPNAIFQNLEYLAIDKCSTLRYVFSSHSVVECLVQLQELYVYECPNLEAVIGASEEGDNCDMIEFPKLKILFLVDLQELTRFYCTVESRHPVINCPKLEQRCFSYSGKFNTHLNLSKFRSSNKVHECNVEESSSVRERLRRESKSNFSENKRRKY